MSIITVGIDLAKNVFAVHGVDETGRAVLVKPKVRRETSCLPRQLPCCYSKEKVNDKGSENRDPQRPSHRRFAGLYGEASGGLTCWPAFDNHERNEMPTGYTAAIADDITFDEFVMSCARGMGALVMMRDEPSGAPIPERFEPSDYHTKKIAEATTTIDRLAGMTEAEAEQAASEAYEATIAAQAAAILRNDTLREKYNAMLAKVRAWQAPSDDHDGFKKFMAEQITSSIDFDCDNRYYREQKHAKLTGAEWREQEEAKARKDIVYHEAENAKEIERTEGRNTWLRQLRESLKTANVEVSGLRGFSRRSARLPG